MKLLSQSLEELAGRVKELEDSAKASRAELEQRRQEMEQSVTAGAYQFGASIDETIAAGRTQWADTKEALRKPFEEIRARHDKRRSEQQIHRTLRGADIAEADAADAVEIATYALNVAEYAVIDAVLARMAADDLAGEPTGSSESAAPVGVTS